MHHYESMSKKDKAKAYATGVLVSAGVALGSLYGVTQTPEETNIQQTAEETNTEDSDLDDLLIGLSFMTGLGAITFGGQSLKYTSEHLKERKRAKEYAKRGKFRNNGPGLVMPPEKTLGEKLKRKGKKLKRKYF